MPKFVYEALDSKGRVIQGQMEAPNVESVVEELKTFQYTVTNIKEQKDYLASLNEFLLRFRGVSIYSLAIFTRQFATVFNAGLPLLRGLQGLARQTIDRKLAKIIQQIHDDVKGGFSLTRALQKHSNVFSPVYIALVRAGEMAGALGEILERLATLLERDYSLRKKVQTSMTYPAFVFVVSIIVTFVLVNYIFPSFVSLLEGLDLDLPWPTLFLIHLTNASRNIFVIGIVLIIVGLTSYLFKQYFNTPLGKRQLHRLLIELPVIGKINRKVAIARFCRTLGTLLGSGVPMVHALDVVSKVAGNEIISDIIEEIKMGLKGGMRLSQPLRMYKIFPPMVSQMIAVGEETGNLPQTLEKLADFYDAEVESALEAFVTLVEPVMILIMGGIVSFVMVAVFLPVYGILQKF